MKHNTLRHYQLSHVNRILRQVSSHNEAALVSCVGSGKTLTASVVGSEAMNRGIVNRVICATPFTTIAEEFKRYTGTHWASNAQNNSQFTIRPIVEDEGVKHVADVVKCSDEFLVTTHAAMASKKALKAIDEAEDLSGLLLMIDEAHHCFSSEGEEEDNGDGTLLGESAKKILAKGGKVLYITATPYRNYGGTTNLIFDPNLCNPVVRTIGEQMREGLAPSMHVEYMHVQDMTLTNAGQSVLFGDGVSTRIGDTQLRHALPIIREKWIADGCPKAILIIPAGNSEHTAKAVASYFTSQGFPEDVATVRGRGTPNVLEAVGTDKQRILAGLTADKEACGHMFDLVIACRKFDEGTDVNTASHLYMIGLPSNVRLFHQRAGRVLRDKKGIPGYDAWFGSAWNNQSRVVFFAPAGKKTKEFDFKVGRQLLHCIFAAESYQEYCEALNFSQSIRIEFESEEVPEEDKSLVEDLMARLADIELSAMKDQSSDEYELLVGSTLNPGETVLDKVNQIKADASLSAEDKAKAYSLLLNHLPEGALGTIDVVAVVKSLVAKAKAKKFVKDEAADTFDLTPSELICEEFEEILKRFNTAKVASTADDKAKSVYSEISGHDFQEWAEQCHRYMGEEGAKQRASEVIAFITKNGKEPSQGGERDEERSLALWLRRMRSVKCGSSAKGPFPEVIQSMADAAGMPQLFEFDLYGERDALGMLEGVLEHIAANGRPPISSQKPLGQWLAVLRGARIGKGKRIWYPSLQARAEEAGYPDLFDVGHGLDKAVATMNVLLDYVNKNGGIPKHDCPERRWLYMMKSAKNGNHASIFYPELQKMAEDAGIPELFSTIDRVETAKEKCLAAIKFCKDNGRAPSIKDEIGGWLFRTRQARVGKGEAVWDDQLQAMAEESGLPDLFVSPNADGSSTSLAKCKEFIKFYKDNGRLPPKGSPLSNWVNNKRNAVTGNSSAKLHVKEQELLVEAGLMKVLLPRDRVEEAKEILLKLIEYIKEERALPSVRSSLGQWRYDVMRSLSGKKPAKFWTPEVLRAAEEAGFPGLFTREFKCPIT